MKSLLSLGLCLSLAIAPATAVVGFAQPAEAQRVVVTVVDYTPREERFLDLVMSIMNIESLSYAEADALLSVAYAAKGFSYPERLQLQTEILSRISRSNREFLIRMAAVQAVNLCDQL